MIPGLTRRIKAIRITKVSGCGSVWLERYLREVEAASSNLVTPIKKESPLGLSFFIEKQTPNMRPYGTSLTGR